MAYFYGGSSPLGGSSLAESLVEGQVSQFAAYLLGYLGAPLIEHPTAAAAAGALGLTLYIGLVVQALGRRDSGPDLRMVAGREALVAGEGETLKSLFPDSATLETYRSKLKSLGLSIFRDTLDGR